MNEHTTTKQPIVTNNHLLSPHFSPLESQLFVYQTLYTHLKLSDSFNAFCHLALKSIPCDSIIYNNQEHNLKLQQGHDKKYSYTIPLTYNNQSIGDLTFGHDTPFSRGIQQELDGLCTLWLLPLFHALQYHIALQTTLQDHLTRTGNRAAYEKVLEQETHYAKRHDSPLTMLLIDIDHFKLINDQYGHHQGDLILQQFADQLKELVRDSDMVFRYGGEEFVVLLRNTDLEGANLLAKRICEAVHQATHYKVDKKMSVSIGSCEFDHYDTYQQFFQRADKALYHAKQQGRNCVASYHALDADPALLSS